MPKETGDTNVDAPPPGTIPRAMDQKSGDVLIGRALFLEVEHPGHRGQHFSANGLWFRGTELRPYQTFADFVKQFLDSVSLLLVPCPVWSRHVTACGLDLQLTDSPAEQRHHATSQLQPDLNKSRKHPIPDDAAPARGPKRLKGETGEPANVAKGAPNLYAPYR
jgi:hypothetical protein